MDRSYHLNLLRLHLKIETVYAVLERNSGVLVAQTERYSVRLEWEACRGRFRSMGGGFLSSGDLQVN